MKWFNRFGRFYYKKSWHRDFEQWCCYLMFHFMTTHFYFFKLGWTVFSYKFIRWIRDQFWRLLQFQVEAVSRTSKALKFRNWNYGNYFFTGFWWHLFYTLGLWDFQHKAASSRCNKFRWRLLRYFDNFWIYRYHQK